MRDKLREYIQDHLAAFDRHEAPDVWAQVSAGIQTPKTISKPLNKITMFKYGIGLSILTTGTILVFNQKAESRLADVVVPVRQAETKYTTQVISDSLPVPQYKPAAPALTIIENDPVQVDPVLDSVPQPVAQYPAPIQEVTAMIAKKDSMQSPGRLDVDTMFAGVTVLELDVQDCNLFLKGTSSNGVHLRAHIAPGGGSGLQFGKHVISRRQDYLRYQKSGGKLRVWITCEKTHENIKRNSEASEIRLEIPAGLKILAENGLGNISADSLSVSDISLSNDFGNIHADHINGPVKVATSSGKLRISHITGEVKARGDFGSLYFEDIHGDLSAVCSSGHVQVNALVGNADVQSSFGSQRFVHVTGNIKSSASSGGLLFDECTGDVIASSDFGSQTFRKIAGSIHAEASSGTIKLTETTGALDIETSFGSIKGENVRLARAAKLKASSGTIHIDFVNSISELRFDLNCDSGTASVIDGDNVRKAEHHLSAGDGSILVTGTTTFGSQSYR